MKETESEKKEKESILVAVKNLVKIHGLDLVRLTCNKYFADERAKKRLSKEVEEKQAELEKLKSKLGG